MNRKVFWLLVLIFMLWLVTPSCAEKSASEAKSQFLGEINYSEYIETNAPSALKEYKWDFSSEATHTYSYEQDVEMDADFGDFDGGKTPTSGQSMTSKGSLLVKSKGDGTADIVLKDIKAKTEMDFGKGEETKTMEQTLPPSVIQGMREDGSGSVGDSSQNTMLKLLFPLPTKPLKVGESVDIPTSMPFNARGSMLHVKGYMRVTLARYVTIGDGVYAQFNIKIDIAELDVPEELEGEYECWIKGDGIYYFDVAQHRFASGTTAVLMRMSVDAPSPKINMQDMPAEAAKHMQKRMKITMTNDNLIKVKLKE
jgi:hypothetical protein